MAANHGAIQAPVQASEADAARKFPDSGYRWVSLGELGTISGVDEGTEWRKAYALYAIQ